MEEQPIGTCVIVLDKLGKKATKALDIKFSLGKGSYTSDANYQRSSINILSGYKFCYTAWCDKRRKGKRNY